MSRFTRLFAVFAVSLAFLAPAVTSAQTTNAELQAQISALLKIVAELQAQLLALQDGASGSAGASVNVSSISNTGITVQYANIPTNVYAEIDTVNTATNLVINTYDLREGGTGSVFVPLKASAISTGTYVVKVTGGTQVYAQTAPFSLTGTAPVCSVTVAPTANGSLVTWSSTGATAAESDLTPNSNVSSTALPIATNGSTVVNPSTNTVYSFWFQGAGGATSCSTTVIKGNSPSVQAPGTNQPMPTCSLSATNTTANGGNTTISWSTTNATSLTITNIGSVTHPASGSIGWTITSPTTFTGTATNESGATTCRVTVSPPTTVSIPPALPPSCSMNISNDSAVSGWAYKISWTTTGAKSAALSGGATSNVGVPVTGNAFGQSTNYYVAAPGLYTLTVTSADGLTGSCTAPAPAAPVSAASSNSAMANALSAAQAALTAIAASIAER